MISMTVIFIVNMRLCCWLIIFTFPELVIENNTTDIVPPYQQINLNLISYFCSLPG